MIYRNFDPKLCIQSRTLQVIGFSGTVYNQFSRYRAKSRVFKTWQTLNPDDGPEMPLTPTPIDGQTPARPQIICCILTARFQVHEGS